MKLSNIANIRTGLVMSRKEAAPDASTHEYVALNLRAVSAEGNIDHEVLEPYFASAPLKSEYLTKEDDVLLRLSSPYTVVWIGDHEIDLLVPAHFAIIRVHHELVDAAVLSWWLTNHKKLLYKGASGGTMMGTISLEYIGDMDISPPDIERQRELGHMLKLADLEQKLLYQLAQKKKQLTDGAFNQIINGGK